VPSALDNRSAVSGLMARLPCTISLIPARRNAYRLRQPVLTDVEWAEKLLEQDLTRMNRLMHAFRDQFLPSQ